MVIILATLLAYQHALPGPYLWDDLSLIADNPTLENPANLARYFVDDLGRFNQHPREMGFYRPLQALTFHIEVALFGRNAPVQRATNVLLHALAALALFGLARTFFERTWPALLAALLFAVHPLCSEQVCLIANRGGLLVGALSLSTLYLLARAFADDRRVQVPFLALAGLTYMLALLAKPNALVLIAPALAWLWTRQPARPARQYVQVAALIGGLALAYVVWRWGILGISHAHKATAVPLWTRLLAMPRLTLEALTLAVVPHGLRPIRDPNLAAWAAPLVVVFSTAVWLAILGRVLVVAKTQRTLLFAVLLFAATMAPTAGLIALVRPVAEHYYYLPAAAAALLLATAFGGESTRIPPRLGRLAAVALLTFFLVSTMGRARLWASPEALWADNIAKDPAASEALNNLGTLRAEARDDTQAFALFDRAVRAKTTNLKARRNRAQAALAVDQDQVAGLDVLYLLDRDPCDQRALLALGRLAARGTFAPADALATAAPAQKACAVTVLFGRAYETEKRGDTAYAIALYGEFLSRAPDHILAPAARQRAARIAPPKDDN